MNTYQISAIEQAIQAVEHSIKQDINLDVLAKEVGLSKYYLHHLFKSITNKSLMTYVRNRKLSLSLYELFYTNLNIIDIANEYHFEHEQSYKRAFKQKFNMTPALYRKVQCQLTIEPVIDTSNLKQIGQGIVIQPHIVLKPAFYIEGIQKEIIHKENYVNKTTNQLAEEFWDKYRPLIPNRVNEEIYFGFVSYRDHQEYSNDYATCVEVSHPNPKHEPFVQYALPSQEYAVFRYIGLHNPHEITYETLYQLYGYIDLEWMMNTDYRQIQPYHFERIDLC